jgi:hypothetical protein
MVLALACRVVRRYGRWQNHTLTSSSQLFSLAPLPSDAEAMPMHGWARFRADHTRARPLHSAYRRAHVHASPVSKHTGDAFV